MLSPVDSIQIWNMVSTADSIYFINEIRYLQSDFIVFRMWNVLSTVDIINSEYEIMTSLAVTVVVVYSEYEMCYLR